MALISASSQSQTHRISEIAICQHIAKRCTSFLPFNYTTTFMGQSLELQAFNATPFSHPKKKQPFFFKKIRNLKKEPDILQASSMEEIYNALASCLFSAATKIKPGCKYIVGLAGPPGAGKSTVAIEVVKLLNALWHTRRLNEDCCIEADSNDIAISVPMDGFHLYRCQLDAMKDPVEAHARRGASWTFNALGLIESLTALRNQGFVYLPSFDHGVGDPVENDIFVKSSHKVVLVEGNYLLLTEGDWKRLEEIFDERWFLDIDIDKAMDRVRKRHILTGKTMEEAKWRVEYNDRRNAEQIAKTKDKADLIIHSVDFA